MLRKSLNSYISVCEADRLIWTLCRSDAPKSWDNLNATDKEGFLLRACAELEALPFKGRKASVMQTLAFPRNGGRAVPEAIKQAQALLALALGAQTADAARRESLQAQGVTSFSIGDLSESYGGTGGGQCFALRDKATAALLRPYLGGGFAFA